MFSVMEARRRTLNISQQDLARNIGCSQPEISLMENGYQAIPERFLEPLSKILQATPEELGMNYEEYLTKKMKGIME